MSWSLAGCYITSQALHQNDLFNKRRSVDEVLQDEPTLKPVRAQLERVRDVLAFAADQGLNTQGAYNYYIQTDEPAVSYLVQAAEADRLQFVTWWFPVVGKVPYLGFFRRDERDSEALRLRAAGYDVTEAAAGAFSSLGWFDDPIFSPMLTRGDADLAHLFFHELTHRTLWVSNAVNFNENLAEYVAAVLTRAYLTRPDVSAAMRSSLIKYELKRHDREKFSKWLAQLKHELELLYEQGKGWPKAELLRKKSALFASYQKPPLKPRFQQFDYVAAETWNNAAVLGASLYAPDFVRFEHFHRCFGNAPIKEFLSLVAMATADQSDPFLALERHCGARSKRQMAVNYHVD